METLSITDFKRLELKIDQLLESKATSTKVIVDMAEAKRILFDSSDNYVKALIAKGTLKTAKKHGGKWLFDRNEILNLVPSYQSAQ